MAEQRKPPVLVVDDESAILESLRAILDDDFEVLLASSGADALRIVREKVPMLVFLDLKFPGENGIEILTTIKQFSPRTKVIMETGYPDMDSALRSIELGACDYLTKPFGPKEVESTLEAVLQEGWSAPDVEDLTTRWRTKRRTTFGRAFAGRYAFD